MNKTAQRRMKLFDDAGYYGAQILKSPGWICAVCRTYDQTHCFGRGKPKVKLGTNTIDDSCNLRDDEGITPECKARRDSGLPWVKDGIGFDDQPFEAGWCVMGGNSAFFGSTLAWGPGLTPCGSYEHGERYCSAKENGEVCPYLVFLELSTGKLYISNVQYAQYGMMPLKDGWWIADFNCELNGDSDGGVRQKILNDAGFAEIMQKAVDASLKGLTGSVQVDVFAAAKNNRPAVRRSGKTVMDFIRKVKETRCQPDAAIQFERKGRIFKITDIVEGAGSSIVFVVGSGNSVTIKDFVKYCKSVGMTADEANRRVIEIKFFFSIFGISQMDASYDGDFTLKY